eukprot:GEMP01071215.1.p1 GENE.GEMP01071215.1~~GEMP01071215.1.p1  ORF type:complete len:305 (+),score=68.67 GEMP01071215.1:74-988(+)
MGDTLLPPDIVERMLIAGKAKAEYPAMQLIVRGIGAGALLAVATALSVNAWVMEEVPKIVGDLIFPVGFVLLMLTGTELLTGNFALLPMAVLAGKIRVTQIPRAWACVLLGNLIGSVLYGMLFYFIYSDVGTIHCSDAPANLPPSFAAATKVCKVASGKTFAYEQMIHGRGWAKAFFKAILCNWMVCYGTAMNFSSQSLMLDAPHVNFYNWILWNLFPVSLGNLVGGLIVALHHWYMHAKDPATSKLRNASMSAPLKRTTAEDGVPETDDPQTPDLATPAPVAPIVILPVTTSIATTPDDDAAT